MHSTLFLQYLAAVILFKADASPLHRRTNISPQFQTNLLRGWNTILGKGYTDAQALLIFARPPSNRQNATCIPSDGAEGAPPSQPEDLSSLSITFCSGLGGSESGLYMLPSDAERWGTWQSNLLPTAQDTRSTLMNSSSSMQEVARAVEYQNHRPRAYPNARPFTPSEIRVTCSEAIAKIPPWAGDRILSIMLVSLPDYKKLTWQIKFSTSMHVIDATAPRRGVLESAFQNSLSNSWDVAA